MLSAIGDEKGGPFCDEPRERFGKLGLVFLYDSRGAAPKATLNSQRSGR